MIMSECHITSCLIPNVCSNLHPIVAVKASNQMKKKPQTHKVSELCSHVIQYLTWSGTDFMVCDCVNNEKRGNFW